MPVRFFVTFAVPNGGMPEWTIGAVSKTVVPFGYQGFESLSLRKAKRAGLGPALMVWEKTGKARFHRPSQTIRVERATRRVALFLLCRAPAASGRGSPEVIPL